MFVSVFLCLYVCNAYMYIFAPPECLVPVAARGGIGSPGIGDFRLLPITESLIRFLVPAMVFYLLLSGL